MKKLLLATTVALVPFTATAGQWTTECSTQRVAYQETVNGANSGDVLGGAIIGGIIGKAAGGNDESAAIGAIIGGAIANEEGKRTVTKYRDVEVCNRVYSPDEVTPTQVERTVERLADGVPVSKEMIRDVQYTIGVKPDGVWGPNSRRAANEYLNTSTEVTTNMYSLMVNGVVVIRSADINVLNAIRDGLANADVDAYIFVDAQ